MIKNGLTPGLVETKVAKLSIPKSQKKASFESRETLLDKIWFAAAVSMIFATVIAFAWQGQYGALSANLFIALVIGYIFKDRIKDLLKEQLSKRLKKRIPDRRLEILRDERYHVGDCKESFEFFDVRRLPEPVRRLRQRAQSVKVSCPEKS